MGWEIGLFNSFWERKWWVMVSSGHGGDGGDDDDVLILSGLSKTLRLNE